MADKRFGFVDDGNIPFIPKKECECGVDVKESLDKLKDITEGAPEELDTFKEVAEKFKTLELGEVDLSNYITKTEAQEFITKDDIEEVKEDIDSKLECYVTNAELQSELNKIDLSNYVTQTMLDEALKNNVTCSCEIEAITTEELDEIAKELGFIK